MSGREHTSLTAEIREDLGEIPGTHPRHPDAIAELIAAYRLYLEFAVETGAIEHITANAYTAKAREYLVELAEAEAGPQSDAKPGRKFLNLIAATLQSKRCHLAVIDSDCAPSIYPGACGWHRTGFTRATTKVQSSTGRYRPTASLLGSSMKRGTGLPPRYGIHRDRQ